MRRTRRPHWLRALAALLLLPLVASAASQKPALGRRGMVVTSQVEATRAGSIDG